MEGHVSSKWVSELIERIGLKKMLHQRYGTLSGGQKRRVDIARALLGHPQLLFLDEPTTGLDIQTRQAIWKLISQLQKEQGLTVFLTTHYLEEAAEADQIYILSHGKILATGSAADIVDHYSKSCLVLTLKGNSDMKEGHQIRPNQYEFRNLDWQSSLKKIDQYREQLVEYSYQPGDLNDAFLNITGEDVE